MSNPSFYNCLDLYYWNIFSLYFSQKYWKCMKWLGRMAYLQNASHFWHWVQCFNVSVFKTSKSFWIFSNSCSVAEKFTKGKGTKKLLLKINKSPTLNPASIPHVHRLILFCILHKFTQLENCTSLYSKVQFLITMVFTLSTTLNYPWSLN